MLVPVRKDPAASNERRSPAQCPEPAKPSDIAAGEDTRAPALVGSSNMATIAGGIFLVAALQEEARFFVAFFLEIMQERGRSIARQLTCQFIDPRKQRYEVRPGIGGRHGSDLLVQLNQGLEY